MRRIPVGDIEVACTERGEGPPVVLVHGLAEDRRSWATVQAAIGARHTLAVDLRGHGGTTLGDAEGTLAQLGADLARLLETRTGPAACVGYSLGGTVVLWAAAHHPDLVSRAVVTGTSTVVGRAAVDFFAARIEAIGRDREAFAADLREDTRAQIATRGHDLDAIVARRLEAIGDGGGYVNAARAMMRLRDEPLTPLLASVRCPVTVIGGEHDAFCPRRAADIMLDALARASYREIAGAGHLMTVDRPAEYAAAIREALGDADASR